MRSTPDEENSDTAGTNAALQELLAQMEIERAAKEAKAKEAAKPALPADPKEELLAQLRALEEKKKTG